MPEATTTPELAPGPDASASRPARRWAALVYLLFFLSGLTSLIYEVVWVRRFGEVFGVTTYATSTVLAAFFAGLATGSFCAGRLIDRGRWRPLVVYGLMEGAIGVYALLLPTLLRLIEAAYPAVYTHVGENFSLFTLFRFVASFLVLAIPTTLMGATLPVLSKLMVVGRRRVGDGGGSPLRDQHLRGGGRLHLRRLFPDPALRGIEHHLARGGRQLHLGRRGFVAEPRGESSALGLCLRRRSPRHRRLDRLPTVSYSCCPSSAASRFSPWKWCGRAAWCSSWAGRPTPSRRC